MNTTADFEPPFGKWDLCEKEIDALKILKCPEHKCGYIVSFDTPEPMEATAETCCINAPFPDYIYDAIEIEEIDGVYQAIFDTQDSITIPNDIVNPPLETLILE